MRALVRFGWLAALLTTAGALSAQVNGRGGTLKGSVKGPNGDPIPGASVSVADPDGSGGLKITSTDGDGWFAFGKLETGTYRVTATVPGSRLSGQVEASVRAPFAAVSHVTLTPEPESRAPARAQPVAMVSGAGSGPARLAGEVMDRGARPLARVLIQLRREDGAGPGTTLATGSDGRFELTDLDPGRYSLYAHRTGYSDILASELEIGAQPSEQVSLVLVPFSLDIKSELAALSAAADRLLPIEAGAKLEFLSRGYALPAPPEREE
ncbi:MAG TPA: carboxypeptidase-like regulatory domain-containing protein [Acidobacteriota bacterium]